MSRVAGKTRGFVSEGTSRLRAGGWSIVQTAVAAGVAYLLAVYVLGHNRPLFAPIAAVITLSITVGSRGRRTIELVAGVAVGLMVADVISLLIGTGWARISLVVALAMAAALFFGAGTLLVNQAAISAIFVMVLQPPNAAFSPDRFLDALTGSLVALAIHSLFPINPERLVERAARPIFDDLVSVLEEVSAALKDGDLARAEGALRDARRIDGRVKNLNEALAAGHETARLSPSRRRALKHLELYSTAGNRIELAVINVRVLARGATNATRRGDQIPQELPEAVLDLSRSVKALAVFLEEPGPPDEARSYALKAAGTATEILQERHDLAISVLVGQVRSAAMDLLRSTGMDQASALEALEEAAGRASDVG